MIPSRRSFSWSDLRAFEKANPCDHPAGVGGARTSRGEIVKLGGVKNSMFSLRRGRPWISSTKRRALTWCWHGKNVTLLVLFQAQSTDDRWMPWQCFKWLSYFVSGYIIGFHQSIFGRLKLRIYLMISLLTSKISCLGLPRNWVKWNCSFLQPRG